MKMGRMGEPDWYVAELSPIPTLPGEILKKTTPTLLHLSNVLPMSREELEMETLRENNPLRKSTIEKIKNRERREQAEKQRRKEEQEEKYKASQASTKAIDEENNRRLAIALELASKKQEEVEDDDEWSEESISRFCSGTKTIVIDDIPNSPRSEAIVQDVIKSLNPPA